MAQTMPRSGPQPLRPRKRELPFPLNLYQTAVGKKWVMALTGIALLGYVLVHMLGNLHVYEGPVKMHQYAEALRDLGGDVLPRTWVLWGLRIGLIAAFVLHIHSAFTLTRMNRAANVSYADGGQGAVQDPVSRFASRTMRWTGVIVLLFIFYHLADLTWGWWPWVDFVHGDPYHNIVSSLEHIPVALLYIAANIALALHIYHGAWSIFQSLGINNPRFNRARKRFAQGFAAIILIGNLSFPIMVQIGVVDEENRQSPIGFGHDDDEATATTEVQR